MAPALSSSTFGMSTPQPHHTKLRTAAPRFRAAVVFAKQGDSNGAPFGAFRLGARKGSSERQDEVPGGGAQKQKKPFFADIDLGKLPGTTKSLVPAPPPAGGIPAAALIFNNWRRKDPRAVFVAGAMGQAGVRIARTLLRQGFSVRAGVPDLAAAQELAQIAARYKIISPDESKRLNAVEATFVDAESIARAVGNATKVVVTIGRGEDGPSGEITTDDAFQVVRAAQLAGAGHVIVIYDAASPAVPAGPSTMNVLDGITSFFNNIFSQSKPAMTLAEFTRKVVEETEISYTLVKASIGDDDAAAGDGLVVAAEGSGVSTAIGTGTSATDYKVTRSQIASLVAGVFSNTAVAENKVVRVARSTSAPSKSVEELFSVIPEDGRRSAYREGVARARAAEEALITSEKARQAAEAAKKLEEEAKKPPKQEALSSSLAEEARKKAAEAGTSLDNILSKAKDQLGADFSWEKLSTQFAAAAGRKGDDGDGTPETQVATMRGQARARRLPPQRAVVKKAAAEAKGKLKQPKAGAKPKPADQKVELTNVLGGLFKQETIYIDDD